MDVYVLPVLNETNDWKIFHPFVLLAIGAFYDLTVLLDHSCSWVHV